MTFIRDCLLSVLDDVWQSQPCGCVLVNMANAFSSGEPAVQALVETAARRMRQVCEQAFAQAQASG